jgi:hypothetical protein
MLNRDDTDSSINDGSLNTEEWVNRSYQPLNLFDIPTYVTLV